ncbi:hypothetical protein [Eubacterium sp. An11]|uniref:hypothetical protein n=1 Tax=Eubacterium sp. An11 TaxID=1965542 RepID=UPI0013A648EA|nr:hypothetical protein [Eubacterium sp. An11]
MAVQQRQYGLGCPRIRGSAVFRLCQRNESAVRWNTKGLPSVSKTDHPKGGFAASVMAE